MEIMPSKCDLFTEAVTIPPRDWKKEHVEVLPKKYLLDKVSTFTLNKIWQYVSEELKKDSELQSHLPCLEHYNRDGDHLHIDGPPPPKYRCRGCKRAQQELERPRSA